MSRITLHALTAVLFAAIVSLAGAGRVLLDPAHAYAPHHHGVASDKASYAAARRQAIELIDAGELIQAEQVLSRLHQRFPAATQILLDLADLHERSGRWRLALQGYQQAQTQEPGVLAIRLAIIRMERDYGPELKAPLPRPRSTVATASAVTRAGMPADTTVSATAACAEDDDCQPQSSTSDIKLAMPPAARRHERPSATDSLLHSLVSLKSAALDFDWPRLLGDGWSMGGALGSDRLADHERLGDFSVRYRHSNHAETGFYLRRQLDSPGHNRNDQAVGAYISVDF